MTSLSRNTGRNNMVLLHLSTIKRTSSLPQMTPSQHSKLPRSQSAKSPCFLTSKHSSTNLRGSSLSLMHQGASYKTLQQHSSTYELLFTPMPSLQLLSVTREFLFSPDTINHNIAISHLTHSLCTNNSHMHPWITFAF